MDEEIKAIIESTQELTNLAWGLYKPKGERLIQALVGATKPPESEVEHFLDGLLDFCFEGRFRALFDKVCRAAEIGYPQLAIDYKKIVIQMMNGELED